MRLAGQEKMGYYPTPASLLDAIASFVVGSDSGGARAVDPCCGMGEALAHVAANIGAHETWGAELSSERSHAAALVLTKVHHCAWQACRAGRGVASLIWLNPPYHFDSLSKTRLEQQFLEDASPVLCAGGVLIYIIPQQQLGTPAIARRLAGHYEQVRIFRFPDEEYAAFKQVVVFAVKKRHYTAPTQDAVESILRYASLAPEQTPVLALQLQPSYIVPPALSRDLDGRAPLFRRVHWTPEELIEAAHNAGVRTRSRAWQDALAAIHSDLVVQPAMPLKKGHIAMLMAAGLMGVMTLERTNDDDMHEPIIAKGRVIKTKKIEVEEIYGPGGRVTATKVVEKDVFVTSVATLDARGGLEVIKDEAGLSRFMQAYGEQLAQQVIAKHTPEYDLKPTQHEWNAVSRVALNMRLPGRKEGGLLPAQKHVAIAASRILRKRKAAVLNCEMGWGKTINSVAVAEILDAYPAIVLCPPHLVRKWAAEIERAVPGAKARVVNCIERGEETLDDDGTCRVMKRKQTVKLPPYSIMDFARDYRSGKLGHKAVAVLSRERAKLGSGWAPVAIVRKLYSKEQGQWVEYLADPDTGEILLDDQDAQLIADPASWKFLASKQRFSHTEPVKGWELIRAEGARTMRRSGRWDKRIVCTALFTQGQGTGSLHNLPGRCSRNDG